MGCLPGSKNGNAEAGKGKDIATGCIRQSVTGYWVSWLQTTTQRETGALVQDGVKELKKMN
jgi:hypothetical protein